MGHSQQLPRNTRQWHEWQHHQEWTNGEKARMALGGAGGRAGVGKNIDSFNKYFLSIYHTSGTGKICGIHQ